MKLFIFSILFAVLVFAVTAAAQVEKPVRKVKGKTLISKKQPKARLKFAESFEFAGSQAFILNKIARAEQYFFIEADAQKQIKRVFIAQFEGFLPGVKAAYDYEAKHTLKLGGLDFITNAAAVNVEAALKAAPDSDAAKAAEFLKSKGYSFGADALFQRFIRVIDEAKSREFILIYIENLTEKGLTAKEFSGHAEKERLLGELQERAVKSVSFLKD